MVPPNCNHAQIHEEHPWTGTSGARIPSSSDTCSALCLLPSHRLQTSAYEMTLVVYDKLAVCVHIFFHKTLKLYLGFPKHLLHLPTHLGGFSIPDLCAHAQKTKYSIICRHLRADPSVQHSIDSLLTRAHTINGAAIQPGAPIAIPFSTPSQLQVSSFLWITSLLQFLQKHNLQLVKGGKKVSASPDEPLSD